MGYFTFLDSSLDAIGFAISGIFDSKVDKTNLGKVSNQGWET